MKLLVCTQAVDSGDPVLGFFVRWLEEFSKHCEQVTVICLRKGSYELPRNVRVFALGGTNKTTRAYKLLKGVAQFRNNYDAVLVHMNPEYLVAAGWLWKLLGKKTALWYTHKQVDLKLCIATLFADTVLTASEASFRLPSSKVKVMGHGIDTDFFSPDLGVLRVGHLLSVGRLMSAKRHDLAIREAARAGRELRIAGEGPERKNLETLANELGARVQFLGPLTQVQLRDEYRKAGTLIHRSETGSLDKVVLEALACGLPVDTTDKHLTSMPLAAGDPAYVREHHALRALIPAILKELA